MPTHLHMPEMGFFFEYGTREYRTYKYGTHGCNRRSTSPPIWTRRYRPWLKLREFEPLFLLESVEGGERLARYSFLGFGAGPSLELHPHGLLVDGEPRPRPADAAEWSGVLRRALDDAPELLPRIDGLPFTGGLVGAFGYDVVRYFEELPPNCAELADLPQAALTAPQSLLVFDHLTRRVALLHSGSERERRQLRAEVIRALRRGIGDEAGERVAPRGFSRAEASFDNAGFKDAVRRCKSHIAAGDIYQIVMSARFSGRSDLDPFRCYRALRLLNPSPYLYFFESGVLKVAGSSPEALVRLNRGQASLRPIAGTRPRGTTTREDAALATELLADPKESAEHVMLVDLARNDLGPGWPRRAASTSNRIVKSSATATSCTSSAASAAF